MASYDLGTARGVIEIDYKGDGVEKAKKGFDDVGKSARSAEDVARRASTGMLAAGVTLAAGLGVAAKSAADFEFRLSAIKAVSGATQSEMDAVSKKALQLGADTKFSAGEAAVAIEELVKAGISIPDVMNGAADATVALAAAGELELPRAAEIAANAMNQFKLAAKDLPHVADILAGSANASAVSVEDLGESLNYVGPVAHTLGISIDEVSTALAILGNNGIKGSSAGTALRQILSRLSPSTRLAAKEFEKLGLITKDGTNLFYNARGQLKPMSEVLQILHDKTKNLSDEQKIAFTKKAFGLDSMAAANILMGETSQSFDTLAGSIGKIKSADVAAERLNNLKGSVEQMRGSLETAGIQLGTILLPAIRKVVDGITGLVNSFSNLSPSMQKTIVTVVGLLAGLLLFAGTAIKAGLAIKGMVTGARTLFTALKALRVIGPIMAAIGTAVTGPVGIIIAIVAALGVAFFVAYKKIAPFRDAVNRVGAVLKGLFLAGLERARTLLGIVGGAFQRFGAFLGRTVLPALRDAGRVFMSALGPALQQMKAAITGSLLPALQKLAPGFAQLGRILGPIVVGILKVAGVILGALLIGLVKLATIVLGKVLPALIRFSAWLASGIIPIVAGVISAIVRVIAAIINFGVALSKVMVGMMTAVKNGFQAAWNFVVGIVSGALSAVTGAISSGVSVIQTIWAAFWNGPFGRLLVAVWELIKAIVTLGIRATMFIITTTLAGIQAAWNAAWTAITSAFQTVWNFLSIVVSGALNQIRAFISSTLATIQGIISLAWAVVRANTLAAWNALKAAIFGALNAVLGLVGTNTGQVKATIAAAWNTVKSKTSEVWNALKGIISNAISDFMARVRGIKTMVLAVFSGAGSWLLDAGRRIISGLIDGITSRINAVTAKLRELTSLIPESKGPPARDEKLLVENGQLIMKGLIFGIESQISPLLKTLSGVTTAVPRAMTVAPRPAAATPNVSVTTPSMSFPSKVVLKVGTKEFTGYVEDVAGGVLTATADQINRGTK